jgi:hypothetical protein
MKHPTKPFRQLLDRAQRRFVRSRPGSVLILVVALLVLMALIGTAYMTMAQFDRATSAQHSFNTEVDLLLDGVVNQVKRIVTADLFYNGKFRPGGPTYNVAGSSFTNYTGVGLDLGSAIQVPPNPGSWWLASRTPDLLGTLQIPASGSTTPVWHYISGVLTRGTFNSPNSPTVYPTRVSMVPGQTTAKFDGQFWPSFLNVNGGTLIAADTDGDGIADAGLVKLLTLDGITYYGAVRIIDNCAAINATIAAKPNPATALAPLAPPYATMPGDYSPVNLDLESMLINPAAELYGANGLMTFRFNNQAPLTNGIDENGAIRGDFFYMSDQVAGINMFFDQQWKQLGRRMDNPGNIIAGTATTSKYQALSISENMAMARGFVLRDGTVTLPGNSQSILEQRASATLFTSAPTSPYAANDAATWFNVNFNYAPGVNTTTPMRAVMVARNPVSNFAPSKFTDKGAYPNSPPYGFGDSVTFNGHRFVCINANPTAAPITPVLDANTPDLNWAFEPWSTSPTKTNANTATFQQLYAAYWAVMADQYIGGFWYPAFNNVDVTKNRMFRGAYRPPGTAVVPAASQVSAYMMLQLRAALAAVNTIDLRDGDDNITSRTIYLHDASGVPKFQANIYGTEKQPYITQVYARNDAAQANDWMAIELYNPYNTDISLKGWHVAALKRSSTPMTLTDIGAIPTAPPDAAPVIHAKSFFVIVNNQTVPAAIIVDPAVSVKFAVLPALTTGAAPALGNELVILRPRRADGALLPASTAVNNIYSESNIYDLAPVDSYDFTNLPVQAATAAAVQEWWYNRPDDSAAGKNWHFVYPGRWSNTAGASAPTVESTKVTPKPGNTDLTTFLGKAQKTSVFPAKYVDVPLQVSNVDFAGPLKTAASNNYFPFGGFARNGDLLDVTFIGAYRISPVGAPASIIELNPVPWDSAMATARDANDGANYGLPLATTGVTPLTAENIGRFAPIDKTDSVNLADDFGTATNLWRYHWATRLFDYLTVQSPQDDYTPEVDPWKADPGYPTTYAYPPTSNAANGPKPVPNIITGVANTGLPLGTNAGFNPSNATEETAPINGLVNINTAPWRVLAAVPWYPASTNPANYPAQNAAVAQAIVRYRDVDDGSKKPHGPFKSIFELNEVLIGATKLRDILSTTNTADFTVAQGNFSPLDTTAGTDLVSGDFEARFNTMTRVSNLITTQSDSYTAYILVQGWRAAETPNAHLVVQRRAAIIIDRSAVTPSNPTPTVINVPVD